MELHDDKTPLTSSNDLRMRTVQSSSSNDSLSRTPDLKRGQSETLLQSRQSSSLLCNSSEQSTSNNSSSAEKTRGHMRIFQEIRNFLLLLNFSTDELLNSIFVKKLKNLTWGQTVFFAMVGFILYYTDTFSQRIDGPLVKTKQGYVQGITGVSRGGRIFYEYLGIPYARPPIGELRFEPTLPPEPWKGIRDASAYGSKCVQIDLMTGLTGGSEDCLFINLFSPVKSKKARLPVILYIHGGFFHNGGGAFWRPHYFMDYDVVLVTINYRLNSLGFLNTADGAIRGNMGMKDQTQGLRWLRDNVENFGGDPNRITILGESAGGSCSHLHQYSEMSSGLFHGVISESGSGLHFWSVNSEPRKQAVRFLQQLGCPADNKTEMVRCLKSADAYDIAEIHREVLDPLREEMTIYKPSVEIPINDGNTFLAEHPKKLARKGSFNKVPWIFGVNSEEGLLTSALILTNTTMAEVAKTDWRLFIERTLWYSSVNEVTAEKIRQFYFGNYAPRLHPDPFEILDNYTTMISDRGFYYDAHHAAILQSQHSQVYMYYYSYKGEWSAINYFKEIKGTWPRPVEVAWAIAAAWVRKNVLGQPFTNFGAAHSDELALLFHMPMVSDITPHCKDYQMSLDLIKLWTDFAKNGNSQQNPLYFRTVQWEPVQPQTKVVRYLNIDNNASMIDEPFAERISFWESLLLSDSD